jgi:hypothetical protein
LILDYPNWDLKTGYLLFYTGYSTIVKVKLYYPVCDSSAGQALCPSKAQMYWKE